MTGNFRKVGSDQMLQRLLLGALFVGGTVSVARAEPVAPCVRQIVLTTFGNYACQGIVNHYAEAVRPVLTDQIVSLQRNSAGVDFSNNANGSICGSVKFRVNEFNKSNIGNADAALRFQQLFDAAFIKADVKIQPVGLEIADTFVPQTSEPPNGTSTRVIRELDTIIKELDRESHAAVGASVLVQFSSDRCGVIVDGVGISLPSVVGPDLVALAEHKEAAANYAKFSQWLDAGQILKPTSK